MAGSEGSGDFDTVHSLGKDFKKAEQVVNDIESGQFSSSDLQVRASYRVERVTIDYPQRSYGIKGWGRKAFVMAGKGRYYAGGVSFLQTARDFVCM